MRGIAGIIYPDIFQVSHLIPQMLDMMKHRGKRGRDILAYQNFEVGVCGGKFVSNEKNSLFAALDGTLYNTKELTLELKQLGYNFLTDQPEEIIVHAYAHWGHNFIDKVDGDFAILILDQDKELIYLFRDRLGKKPLYWYQDNNYVIFGSELKALLATGLISQTPDLEALSMYLYFGYVPRDMTPIKSLNKLLAGDYLQVGGDRSVVVHPYWSYSSYFSMKGVKHYGNIIDQVDILLRDSMEARLADVESFGCYIQGGLGSASTAYYAQGITAKDHIPAYTVAYEGQNNGDVDATHQLDDILHLDHHVDYLTTDNFLNSLVKIGWYLDEPLADPQVTSTWRLAEMSAPHVPNVFSGMGYDELFGNHARYSVKDTHSFLRSIQGKFIHYAYAFLTPVLTYIYKPAAYKLLKLAKANLWQFEYLRQNALFDEKNLAEASPRLAKLFDPNLFLHKFYNINRIQSTIASLKYFDVKTRLTDNYIAQFDRLTAAHSLEWTSPFLDRSLVEFLASLPETQHAKGETANYLKKILNDKFPKRFLDRKKELRTTFLSSWAASPEVQDIFRLLTKSTLIDTGLLSEQWLHTALETPQSMQRNFRYLWAFLTLEIWFRLYINGPVATSAPTISLKSLLSET